MKPVSYYHARRAKKLYALVNAMARVNGQDTSLRDFANLAHALAVAIEVEANGTVMALITKMRRKLQCMGDGVEVGDVMTGAFVADARAFLSEVSRAVKYAEA